MCPKAFLKVVFSSQLKSVLIFCGEHWFGFFGIQWEFQFLHIYRGLLRHRGYLVLGSELFSDQNSPNLSGAAATGTVRARDALGAPAEGGNATGAVLGALDEGRLLLTGSAHSCDWEMAKTLCIFISARS